MRAGRPRVAVLLGAAALAAPIPVAAAAASGPSTSRPPTSSLSTSQWDGVASADGVRVSVVVNDFLVVSNIVDAGGPAAQASASALGGSQGLAAYPYPGEIVLTAHGLSQGAVPDYPLVAQSNNSTRPAADVSQGPYDLHTRSGDNNAQAIAQAVAGGGGLAAGTTRSSAAVVHDPGSGAVTADAESTLEGLSVSGVLSIGRFHSSAHLVSTPGGALQRASDTEAADVTVSGQQVGVSDKGLVLPGTDVPLPPDSTANAVLSSAGITVHYLAASSSGSSVVAPGLSITVAHDVPGVGETTVTYVLGQAAATAQSAGGSAGTGTATGLSVTGLRAPPPSTTGGAAAPGPAPPTTTGLAPAPNAGAPPVTAPAPAAGTPGYRLASVAGPSSASLYVVIAGGALVMVAAAALFRVLAVRLAWT